MKVQGHINMVGVVFGYIFGGLGILIIFLSRLGAKHSKKMREGQFYQVGKGWTEPQ